MQPNPPGQTAGPTNYQAMDVMRCVMAMLVVALHSQPLSQIWPRVDLFIVEVLGRLAVPFFFLASGFFFFRKIEHSNGKMLRESADPGRLKTYLVRLLRMYAIWSVIYLPLVIYQWGKNENGITVNLLFLLRNTLFTGAVGHLWYFTALMFAVLALWMLLRYVHIHYILGLALVLYLVGMFDLAYSVFIRDTVLQHLFGAYNLVFATTRNGLFFGLLFVAVGAKLSWMDTAKFRPAVVAPLLAAVLAVMFYEVSALKSAGWEHGFDTYLSLVPAAVLLFVFLLNVGRGGRERPIYTYLRNASLLIYVSHIAFLYVVPKVFALEEQKLPIFLVSSACTLALAVGTIWLSRTYKSLAFLKHVYG